jgi:hypothetical protein
MGCSGHSSAGPWALVMVKKTQFINHVGILKISIALVNRFRKHHNHETAKSTALSRQGITLFCASKVPRPSNAIAEAILNPMKNLQLNDPITVSHKVMIRGRKQFLIKFYQSKTIPSLLHSAKR